MRLVSWNVNGIRAAIRHGMWEWLAQDSPDVLCLQETRISRDQLTEQMLRPAGYRAHWNSAERKGYSGVSILSAQKPPEVRSGFGDPRFDSEGRVLIAVYPQFTLLNVYFPNGRRGHDRVQYKIDFYDALLNYCTQLRSRGRLLIVCGDYNTAHQPIDLARPWQNAKTSGFLPEERAALDRWIESGFVDVYRMLHPDAEEYTWWSYRFNARDRNIGWRIDYFLVQEELLPRVQGAHILTSVPGSDHCPIELQLDLS
ncbi:exodeoxyribonuclease III [Chloroflexota bacterium]